MNLQLLGSGIGDFAWQPSLVLFNRLSHSWSVQLLISFKATAVTIDVELNSMDAFEQTLNCYCHRYSISPLTWSILKTHTPLTSLHKLLLTWNEISRMQQKSLGLYGKQAGIYVGSISIIIIKTRSDTRRRLSRLQLCQSWRFFANKKIGGTERFEKPFNCIRLDLDLGDVLRSSIKS